MRGSSFTKKMLPITDASAKNECLLPKDLVERLLPPLPELPWDPHARSSLHPLNLLGIRGENLGLTRKFVFNLEKHYLGGSWQEFKTLKDLKEGDFIVFARIADRLVFGMHRLKEGDIVTQEQVTSAFQ